MESQEQSVEFDSLDGEGEDIIPLKQSIRPFASEDGSEKWKVMGKMFPRSEVRFFAQIVILYIVIFTCLGNLTVGKGDLNSLWISLLCSCVGYLLPSPYISKKHGVNVPPNDNAF